MAERIPPKNQLRKWEAFGIGVLRDDIDGFVKFVSSDRMLALPNLEVVGGSHEFYCRLKTDVSATLGLSLPNKAEAERLQRLIDLLSGRRSLVDLQVRANPENLRLTNSCTLDYVDIDPSNYALGSQIINCKSGTEQFWDLKKRNLLDQIKLVRNVILFLKINGNFTRTKPFNPIA